ncbi:Uncharacterised protein [Escherichia coli]|nr:Uncharacterised protein [Escherichia coli]
MQTQPDSSMKLPAKNREATKVTNVRLGDVYEDILEREALRTGQTKTAIMKAALAAYEHGLDENGKKSLDSTVSQAEMIKPFGALSLTF